jgi:hypothetical protein
MFYSFDFIDRQGRIDHCDFAYCGNDVDAERIARHHLLRSSVAVRVEVWSEERRVIEVKRYPN